MKEYSNSEVCKAIDEYIHYDRDKAILKDRFVSGMLVKEIADKYNLSERQVMRIIKKADKIFVK